MQLQNPAKFPLTLSPNDKTGGKQTRVLKSGKTKRNAEKLNAQKGPKPKPA